MADGTTIKGAQGNFPFDRNFASGIRDDLAHDPENARKFGGPIEMSLYGAPWREDNPQGALLTMPVQETAAVHEGIPPGVMARGGTSPFYPVQVPDIIGVKDRRYLDRTGRTAQRPTPSRATNSGLISRPTIRRH